MRDPVHEDFRRTYDPCGRLVKQREDLAEVAA
jgi:hypothetical protein